MTIYHSKQVSAAELESRGEGRESVAQGGTTTMITPTLYALTPIKAKSNAYLEYIPGTGIKSFNSVTNKLYDNFDGESNSINLLNKKIIERENRSGCMESGSDIIII